MKSADDYRPHPYPGFLNVTSGLRPGEVLAGRFRVERRLGRGGAGEVYAARDLELDARVALKALRPELSGEAEAAARLRRELLLARKVTHANVCRVYEVFHEPGPDGPGRLFLAMELLEGETLAERLLRAGRLSTREALPLARQLAAALAAAHAVGIVHRDFKPGNVMLVDDPAEPRAVVTDFGLARALGPSDLSSLTGPGALVGTSAYMAPEQVEGGPVTAAADVYALGAVLFEMVTGRKPFVAESALATAVLRLRQPAPSPRRFVPDLDGRWQAAITRCLERDPHDRFADASAVAAALAPSPRPARTRRALLPAAALAAAALALAAAVAPPLIPRLVQAQPAGALRLRAGHAPRPSLAVLGLRNLSGRPDRAWMSTAIADMLGSELTAGERVRLVPGENVARMELDLGLKPGIPAPEMLARVARHLGTELVVVGSYLALGEDAGRRVRLDVRVQDVAEGETLASATDTGREEDLFELVSRTGARLRQGLGLEEPAPTLLAARSAAVPSDPEARRLYAEGLARLRRLDARGAKELLEKVVAAEPAHALAHAALSQALVQLGYEAEARAEARRAFELADVLPREERLVVTAHHQEASADWPAAIESHRLLSRLYPDDPEHGLRLAAAQNAAGHAADALQTIAGLRRVPGADDDPRLDLEECTAARLLSDYPRLRRAAQRALEKGRRRDARHLIARARREEGWALENLGQPDQAAAAFEESKRLYGLAGDPGNLAWTLQSLGVHLAGRGQLAAARQANADALEVFREIGNRNGIASALSTLAIAEWGLGRPDSARRMSEESLALYREIGDEVSVGRLLNNVGFIAHSQGDLSRATVMYEEALGRHRRFGDRRSQAVTLGNLAEIARERGDLPRAGDLVEQALALNRRIGRKGSVALSLHGLGAVEAARGHREAARRAYREALALREELGEKLFAAESRLALAELALDAERAAEAEAIARQASQELHAGQASASEAMAWSLVARARLARGDVAGAQDAVAQAVTLARQSPLQAVTLQARIADARVRTAQGRRAEARRELEAVLADAATAGRVGLQFECRIALAELALAEGHSEAGRQELVAVQREAAALQFGAVSRRAARVSSRPAPKGGVS